MVYITKVDIRFSFKYAPNGDDRLLRQYVTASDGKVYKAGNIFAQHNPFHDGARWIEVESNYEKCLEMIANAEEIKYRQNKPEKWQ